ncbi:peptidylprolyl isomerase [Sphaerisporangium fuscum]|uniref:peptidylprolyl isomerase n=1 Tax=Sphaerisporangium fuscum TaxID=2835868 RepID=UPI001BDBDA18|nr:peptidylprolyl isomerase [Sphaerisporangium fuscum]
MTSLAVVAAEVGDRVVTVAQVDAREAELRAGPLASRLPHPHSAEGRNLRRWLVQMLVTEALVEDEAAALGLVAPAAPPPPAPLTLPAALRTGGVVAAVTASMPLARALRDAVTAGVDVPEDEVRGYYDRNLDRFTDPEVRHVSRLRGQGESSLGPVRRGELTGALEEAVFSAEEGEVVGPVEGPGGPWTLRVDRIRPGGRRPYETVREGIARELTSVAVDQAFAGWLERRYAEKVRLWAGFEHPADPHHADATHRH